MATGQPSSESIAAMLARDHSLSWDEVSEILHDVAPVLIGSQVPTLVVLLAVVGLIGHETALQLASAAAFILLFGYGFAVGRMLGGSLIRQVGSGLVLVVIGALIVGIKAAFH
ncbi:MAG: hypothetical protein KF883_01400 [Thermomicrobiales bacterium]|nr:hypothetical protein [Thermomicrobiales bacterium]